MKPRLLFFLCLTLIITGCSEKKTIVKNYYLTTVTYEDFFQVEVAKWYNGHTAAVSINYDARWRGKGRDAKIDEAIDEVLNRNLVMDFELVTANYTDYPDLVAQMHSELIPHGITFFGHGHKHDFHDNFDFDYCYNTFKLCYDLMKEWGFTPRTYAYPHWAGYKATTQLANELAGFIAARGMAVNPDSVYICPDDEREPCNWYYMPSAAMAYQREEYLSDHAALSPILEKNLEKTAWVIITYHSIGYEEGWGYYPFEEFRKDLDQIAENDYWCGSMDNVTCYIKERNRFQLDVTLLSSNADSLKFKVSFRDDLDNTIYNQPLTLDFNFNTGENIKKMTIVPAIDSSTEFPVVDYKVRLNVVPDEKKYYVILYR